MFLEQHYCHSFNLKDCFFHRQKIILTINIFGQRIAWLMFIFSVLQNKFASFHAFKIRFSVLVLLSLCRSCSSTSCCFLNSVDLVAQTEFYLNSAICISKSSKSKKTVAAPTSYSALMGLVININVWSIILKLIKSAAKFNWKILLFSKTVV